MPIAKVPLVLIKFASTRFVPVVDSINTSAVPAATSSLYPAVGVLPIPTLPDVSILALSLPPV